MKDFLRNVWEFDQNKPNINGIARNVMLIWDIYDV